jgi:hypothetical protein
VADRLIEHVSKYKEGERRGKVVNGLVEEGTKHKVNEGRGEVV